MKFDIERCGYCGACISVCPTGSLELTENRIIIENNKCDSCGRCSIICPLGAFLMDVEKNLDFSNLSKSKISNARTHSVRRHQNKKFWRQ